MAWRSCRHAVAQAPCGLDELAPELAPDARDVHLQGIAGHVTIEAEHQRLQVALGDDPTGAQGQGFDDLPFTGGEVGRVRLIQNFMLIVLLIKLFQELNN